MPSWRVDLQSGVLPSTVLCQSRPLCGECNAETQRRMAPWESERSEDLGLGSTYSDDQLHSLESCHPETLDRCIQIALQSAVKHLAGRLARLRHALFYMGRHASKFHAKQLQDGVYTWWDISCKWANGSKGKHKDTTSGRCSDSYQTKDPVEQRT